MPTGTKILCPGNLVIFQAIMVQLCRDAKANAAKGTICLVHYPCLAKKQRRLSEAKILRSLDFLMSLFGVDDITCCAVMLGRFQLGDLAVNVGSHTIADTNPPTPTPTSKAASTI